MAPDTMCHSFTILEDTEVEPVETFGILLETSDPAVRVTDTFATVSINDSSGISTMYVVCMIKSLVANVLGECRALWGSPDKAMKCMTMLGDVGNVLAKYLQRLMFQDEGVWL